MFGLQPPRHISTLPRLSGCLRQGFMGTGAAVTLPVTSAVSRVATSFEPTKVSEGGFRRRSHSPKLLAPLSVWFSGWNGGKKLRMFRGKVILAAEQAIDTVTASYAAVEPPLRAFFAALDDEQKVRLLRGLSSSGPQAREGDRTPQRGERRSRRRGVSTAARDGEATGALEFARTSSRRCVDGRSARSNAACASRRRSVWLSTNSLPCRLGQPTR